MRAAAVVIVAVLAVAGCGNGDAAGSATLPDCAAGLPLPDTLTVVEVTATPQPDNPTCAITLASDDTIDEVVAALTSELEAAGVRHDMQHQPGRQAVLRLDGPVCGSVLVFAAGTARITDAVSPDRTPALASITTCPVS